MAFGKKYFSSYKSNNNLDYYLEIFLEDYTGSALELVMGAGGPVIEYESDQEDRFSPIISSSCKIPYLVENFLDSTFIDQLRNVYQERQVYVHIYRSTQSQSSSVAPLWSGFLIMDIGSGVDQSFPYVQTLKFVDGLSLLKDIDFVDLGVSGGSPPFEERVQGNYAQENMYYGPATYIFWIREILAKSGAALTNQGASQNYGFTTSVNWYNGEMNATGQSSDPLNKTKCAVSMFHRKDDQGVFYPDNCYTVLKEILRHWGARITYWKHEFWIVQIPEYITTESGTIGTPVNNNSRLYSNTGAFQGSQNHLGSTFYTRYEQTIENDKISKLTGTKYDYLPLLKQVNADFLSFSSKNYFGGFPFGSTATTQEVFQGTINSPSAADFLYLSIPLDWSWDLTNAPNFPNGHTNGWWCAIKFNFYASDGTTTYYLQYDSGTGNYFWVDSATWTPLGNRAPKYIISSKLANVTGHIGFDQQIPFEDENGNAISMTGAWSFFLDIEDYGTSSSNPGSFYINFSGYGSPQRMRNPSVAKNLPTGTFPPNLSGTVSWSNTLQDAQGVVTPNLTNLNPAGFNAGSAIDDLSLDTTSPFMGLLQTLNNSQSSSYGLTINSMNTTSNATKANSEQFNFGRLVWGDSLEYAPSSLQVFDGANYVNTDANGEWGRGVLTGNSTFTKMLIDEFLYGQTKIIIAPSMRLAVGVENKNEDQSGTIRPRYVNPIGILRETRDAADPVYFFRRGSFYTLLDEWDYEGFEIIRNVVTTTTQTNGIGNLGGSQAGNPASTGMSPSPMVQALSQNSPLAYIRTTIPATGSNVAVNGNFNTAVGWSLGSGWSIDTTVKKAKFAATGSTSELTQSVLTQGLTYQVNFKVEVTAGTLLVKAGTSGTSQSITSSGDYSIYLDCEGSSLIKFQAGTTFTGNLTFITLKDQKSLSSVPIEAIGSAVFKTGDTFNLINSNDDTILPLTVTSNQGSGDTTISVSSTPLYEDIDNGSYLLINQDDLSEQYQNKTKGTVAGFGIDADGISKGGIEITGWLNSDTMSGAAVTNVPTALSVKNYVDGQVGASDTLAEVLANGNTSGANDIAMQLNQKIYFNHSGENIRSVVNGDLELNSRTELRIKANNNNASGNSLEFYNGGTEKMRLTSTGRLGIGVSSPHTLLNLNDNNVAGEAQFGIGDVSSYYLAMGHNSAGNTDGFIGTVYNNDAARFDIRMKGTAQSDSKVTVLGSGNVGIGTTSPGTKLHVGTGSGATVDTGYQIVADSPGIAGIQILAANNQSSRVIFGDADDNDVGMIKYDHTDNSMGFRTNGSGNERMRLTSSGNLLVGSTVDSGEKLVVQDSAQAKIRLVSDGNNGARFDLHSTGGGRYSLQALSNGDFFMFDEASGHTVQRYFDGTSGAWAWYTVGAEKMRLTSGGNLGVGESNPILGKLQVAGNIFVNRNGTNGLAANPYFENLLVSGIGTTNVSAIQLGNSFGQDTGTYLRFQVNSNSASSTPVNSLILNPNGTATFSGQVTIPATPVASTDAASKSYVDAHGGGLGPFLPLTGGTLTGDLILGSTSSPVDLYLFGDTTGVSLTWSNADDELQFSDNAKAVFGDSGDLQIYHDQSNSYIKDSGVGELKLLSSALAIQSANGNEYIAYFAGTGGQTASLYAGNSKKFETSSIGANVYGKLLIGTTVDSGDKLQVLGSAIFSGLSNYTGLELKGVGASRPALTFSNASQGDLGIIYGTESNALVIGTGTSGLTALTLDSSQNTTLTGSLTGTSATFSGSNQYNKIQTFFDGSYISGWKFSDYNGGIWYDAGADDLTINSGFVNSQILFNTGSSERMRLTSSGRLGIGKTTVGSKLEVKGTSGSTEFAFKTFDFNDNETFYIQDGGRVGVRYSPFSIGIPSTTAVATNAKFQIEEAGLLTVFTNGNVLINGTTDSGEKLQVDGTAKFTGLVSGITPTAAANFTTKAYVDAQVSATDSLQEVTTIGNTTTNNIMIGSSSSPTAPLDVRRSDASGIVAEFHNSTGYGIDIGTSTSDAYISSGYAQSFIFKTNPGSGQIERMRLTSSGNLLVGSTVDSAKLVVKIGSANDVIQRWETTNGLAGILQTSSDFSEFNLYQPAGNAFVSLKTNGNSYFNGGNVGIGTANPTTLSANTTSLSISSARTDLTGAIFLKANDVNKAQIYWDSTGQVNDTLSGAIKWRTGSAERMRLTSGGNLGINCTPSYKLQWSDGTRIGLLDTNIGAVVIGSVSNDALGFYTNLTERMRLTSGGNLLIGTTTDTGDKLNVSGGANFNGSLTITDYINHAGDSGTKFGFSANDTFVVRTGGAVRLTITDTTLAFAGALTGTTATFSGNVTTANLTSTTGNIYGSTNLFVNALNGYVNFRSNNDNIYYDGGYHIFRDSDASPEYMRLTSGGNLLLGTTTDSGAKLNVQGSLQVGVDDTGYDVTLYGATSGKYMLWDASANALKLRDATALMLGSANVLQLQHDGSDSSISNTVGDLYIQQNANGKDIILQSDNGTGGTTAYITLDGSQSTINLQKIVLIGTTTNTNVYKLDVAGKARVQSVFELGDVLTLNQISTPSDPASGKSSIYMDSADGAIKVKINVGGTVVTRTIASFEG